MKKIFIIGLSCFLFVACGNKEEPKHNLMNFEAKTLKSPSTIYNECLTNKMQNIQLYHKNTSEELLAICQKQADKVKSLADAFGKYN